MKKHLLNMFQDEDKTPEEKAQAEKEARFFSKLMSCSMVLTGIIAAIITLFFFYLYLTQ